MFNSPYNDGKQYVKRLIGLPGETVEIRRGMVYVNDKLLVIPGVTIRRDYANLEKQKIPAPGNRPCVLGINLGKSKITPLDEAHKDYFLSLKLLAPLSDYAVINVSSPNTPGLRSLQGTKQIKNLIRTLKDLSNCPPLLVKIAPDLSNEEIDEIARVAIENGIDGIIAINTSLNRFNLKNLRIKTGNTLEQENGGLSGLPLEKRGLEVIRRLRER